MVPFRCSLAQPRQRGPQPCGVQIVGFGLDVHEKRSGPQPGDGSGGSKEGVRGSDDPIAGAHPGGHQRNQQGIGSGGHAHAETALAVGGDPILELRHSGTQNEVLGLHHLFQRLLNLSLDGGVLLLEIQ